MMRRTPGRPILPRPRKNRVSAGSSTSVSRVSGPSYVLFRVFVQENELVFIMAASGKEVFEMEAAIVDDALDDCEKKVRNRCLP